MPIFRGTLVFFLYWMFLGLNVYFWETYNINYKRVFDIQLKHSNAYSIFKRCFFFLCVWIIIFMLSAFNYIKREDEVFVLIPDKYQKYLPPCIWMIFFGYILFPSKKIFNGTGRLYMFNMIKDLLLSPFMYITFIMSWATD